MIEKKAPILRAAPQKRAKKFRVWSARVRLFLFDGHEVKAASDSAVKIGKVPISSVLPAPLVEEMLMVPKKFSVKIVVSAFFADSFFAIRKLIEFAMHPSLIAKSFQAVRSEVSGKYWASAAGLLIFNTAIAELAACVGRYAGYFGENFGGKGVAAFILLGDHTVAFAAGQIAWFLTTAKALGAGTFRERLSAFGKVEPEVLSMWARGLLVTIPFDIMQFFSFAEMYSSMGAAAISTVANGVLGAAGILGIIFTLTINIDVIAKIAKKLNLPNRKTKSS